MSENSVIESIKSGDEAELGKIYQKYRMEFISWVVKNYSCTIDEAKDVYQLAIVIFYENIISGRLVEMTSSIKSYLFAIGKNKMLEQKKLANKYTYNLDGTMNMIHEEEDSKEMAEKEEKTFKMVENCLNLLGDPCKKLLELYYYQRKSMPEITEILGYKNADTAKNQKYKCMKRLKKIFEKKTLNVV
ncbi:sigma-70 family RNA polymerase sigma factor [Fulvivirgaceae bacterium BMA10]|uniref:Sigma-70 family RNA polymerase sigma factor n=1 Tax=Splendidivirga corallicola TaxID=3051826 RepID=A0ABT8KM02_9BACT|nr:sigma-70 family RNA polymerase sigma factor [Fulvivirgaceae bacterium BMA10]